MSDVWEELGFHQKLLFYLLKDLGQLIEISEEKNITTP
jgi:hypothetical protein